MGRLGWLLFGGFVLSAGACSVLSGADGLAVRDDAAPSSSGSPNGGSSGSGPVGAASGSAASSGSSSGVSGTSGASGTSSGGTLLVDAGPDPDIVFRETFDDAAACAAWGEPSISATWSAGGHDGAGSCTLCASEGTPNPLLLRKTITASKSGRISMNAWLRSDKPPANGATSGFDLGGTQLMVGTATSTAWNDTGSGSSLPIRSGAAIDVLLGMADPVNGGCVTFDDIVVWIR